MAATKQCESTHYNAELPIFAVLSDLHTKANQPASHLAILVPALSEAHINLLITG